MCLRFAITNENAACKVLVKVTPGLNFINVPHTAFKCADPRSIKKTVKLVIFFMVLCSALIKAACKVLVKLTPGVTKNET